MRSSPPSIGTAAKNAPVAGAPSKRMLSGGIAQERVVGEQRDDAIEVHRGPRLLELPPHARLGAPAGRRMDARESAGGALALEPRARCSALLPAATLSPRTSATSRA